MSFKVFYATTFKQRLFGYMFQHAPKYEALLFRKPLMIHMFFVRFPLAVFVLDKKYKVIKKFIIKPWRVSGFYPNAEYFLEMTQLNMIKKIKSGTKLNLKKINN